jgi:hypothetical protein
MGFDFNVETLLLAGFLGHKWLKMLADTSYYGKGTSRNLKNFVIPAHRMVSPSIGRNPVLRIFKYLEWTGPRPIEADPRTGTPG